MEPQHEPKSLCVADAVRGMTDDEVRSLVDEAHASGLVQTLEEVTAFLARLHVEPTS